MSITVTKQVIIDGDDYQTILSALDLTRRYIAKNKQHDRRVDELDPKEVAQIESAMNKFWE